MLPGVPLDVSNTIPHLQGMRNRTQPGHIMLHANVVDAADAHLLMVLARGPTAQPASSLSESLSRPLLRLRGAPLPSAAAAPPLPPRPRGPRWGAALPAAGTRLPAWPPRCPAIRSLPITNRQQHHGHPKIVSHTCICSVKAWMHVVREGICMRLTCAPARCPAVLGRPVGAAGLAQVLEALIAQHAGRHLRVIPVRQGCPPEPIAQVLVLSQPLLA